MPTNTATKNLRAAERFATRNLPSDAARVEGIVLALYRVASGVRAVDVAGVMDVTKQRLATLEREGAIIDTAGRYRAAVDMLAGK